MPKPKQKFYAVRKGRKPGIYLTWEECSQQVTGVPGAIYKSFKTRAEAEHFLAGGRGTQTAGDERRTTSSPLALFGSTPKRGRERPPLATAKDFERGGAADDGRQTTAEVSGQQRTLPMAIDEGGKEHSDPESGVALKQVVLYTDGGCFVNPGPGGYAVVLLYNKHRREISGGFRLTTNNRMELMGCIAGLRLLKESAKVTVNTDSRYIVNSMNKGWAKRWKAARWQRGGSMVPNADLWAELLVLCARHEVTFEWLRGHAGDPENERCHMLATAAMQQPNLPEDQGFNKGSAAGDPHSTDA